MKELLGKPRAWLVLSIVGALLIALLGWLLLISPQLSSASTLQQETADAQQQTATLRAKQAALEKQREQLPAMEAELAALYEKLPTEAGVDALIQEIDQISRANGMTVVEFTVDPPVPVALPEAAAAAAPTAEASGEAPSSAEGGAADDDASGRAGAAAAPEAALSYSTLSMSLKNAPFDRVVSYLDSLENLDRAVLLTTVDVVNEAAEGSAAGTVQLTINGRIYTRPPTEAEAAASASANPTGSASPSPTTSASPSPTTTASPRPTTSQ